MNTTSLSEKSRDFARTRRSLSNIREIEVGSK